MKPLYRVKDWGKHFENNRTRDLKNMSWVPVPNKHDGDGYTDLMAREDGMVHYAAWHLILQVASKCDPRGTLLREGKKPHDSASIARVTRSSEAAIRNAIPVLVEIGWLEVIDLPDNGLHNPALSCGETADNCGDAAPSCIEGKGMEGKEENRSIERERAAQIWTAGGGMNPEDSPDLNTLMLAIKNNGETVVVRAIKEFFGNNKVRQKNLKTFCSTAVLEDHIGRAKRHLQRQIQQVAQAPPAADPQAAERDRKRREEFLRTGKAV